MSRRITQASIRICAGQQIILGMHQHTCMDKSCQRRYGCRNNCDRRHLNDSLCAACFKKAQDS